MMCVQCAVCMFECVQCAQQMTDVCMGCKNCMTCMMYTGQSWCQGCSKCTVCCMCRPPAYRSEAFRGPANDSGAGRELTGSESDSEGSLDPEAAADVEEYGLTRDEATDLGKETNLVDIQQSNERSGKASNCASELPAIPEEREVGSYDMQTIWVRAKSMMRKRKLCIIAPAVFAPVMEKTQCRECKKLGAYVARTTAGSRMVVAEKKNRHCERGRPNLTQPPTTQHCKVSGAPNNWSRPAKGPAVCVGFGYQPPPDHPLVKSHWYQPQSVSQYPMMKHTRYYARFYRWENPLAN